MEDFQRSFSEVAHTFVEASGREVAQIEASIALKMERMRGTIADVSGTHLAESLGKATRLVGQTGVTGLVAFSVSALANTIAAGGTAMAGVAAGAAAVPVVGWVLAAGVLVGGAILKGVAREKRKARLLGEFSRVAGEEERRLTATLEGEAVRSRDGILAAVREQVEAAVRQQDKQAAGIRANLSASAEKKAAMETELRQRREAVMAAIGEIRQLVPAVGEAGVA